MAIKIPTYDRSKQLDAGSQTIPRYPTNDEVGKALKGLGGEISRVGAHWQAKQDQFENFQMLQAQQRAQQQINQIIYEEQSNYDPGRDRPGTLHDRVVARTQPILDGLVTAAPDRLKPKVIEHNATVQDGVSTGMAINESKIGVQYYTKQTDQIAGQLAASTKANPDGFPVALKQMQDSVDGLANVPKAQREMMMRGYTNQLYNSAVSGYTTQGRYDDATNFVKQFRDEQLQREQQRAPAPQSSNDLNQRRIAQIDANPTVKDAIEKAAAATGMDANTLKVVASIESSGRPGERTGSYSGLFQLSKSEFGMNGGGNITDPYDNAMAGARVLASRQAQLSTTLGRAPTATELYMAHQQGMGGVQAHLANPDQPAWKSMASTGEGQQKGEAWAKRAIWGNIPDDLKQRFGSVENVKSSDLLAIYDSKVRGGAIDYAKRFEAPPEPKPTVVADASGNIIGGMQTSPRPAPAPAAQYAGLQEPGNIDLKNRPQVPFEGGTATVRSISINEDGKEVLIPTVVNGKVVSNDEAIAHYRATGQHLGKFDTPDNATAAGQAIHLQQAQAIQPQSVNQWDSQYNSSIATIEASRSKASAIDASMKSKLDLVLKSDVASLKATGTPVQLPNDLASYFKTDKLTHEFVSNKLGEGRALTWEEDRQTAQRVYGATANMDEMPQSVIFDRLSTVAPQPGSPDFARQQKVYGEASQYASRLLGDRQTDPAAAADNMPDVKALLDKVTKNPSDMGAAKELVQARMRAQEYLQIPDAARTPITQSEAKQVAFPFADKTQINANIAAKTVIDSVRSLTGNDPDLTRRALATVLQVKGVTKEQSDATATLLEQANRPLPAPGVATKPASNPDKFNIKDGYYAPGNEGVTSGDIYAPEKPASVQMAKPGEGFVPGTTMIPADQIRQLRNNPQLQNEFDASYGQGAAKWVFDNAPKEPSYNNAPPSDNPNADVFAPVDVQSDQGIDETGFNSDTTGYP